MIRIDDEGKRFIRKDEGCLLYVYDDAEPAELVSEWRRGPGAAVPAEVARVVADAIGTGRRLSITWR